MNDLRTVASGLMVLTLAGCPSASDQVCSSLGACATWSSAQVQACQAEATSLGNECDDAGCGPAFDQYFGCANSAYVCTGATATFPGCGTGLQSLNSCLQAERSANACGLLTAALSSCEGSDGGAIIPEPCGANEVCASTCYLENVSAPCAPTPSELSAMQTCVSACP